MVEPDPVSALPDVPPALSADVNGSLQTTTTWTFNTQINSADLETATSFHVRDIMQRVKLEEVPLRDYVRLGRPLELLQRARVRVRVGRWRGGGGGQLLGLQAVGEGVQMFHQETHHQHVLLRRAEGLLKEKTTSHKVLRGYTNTQSAPSSEQIRNSQS